LRWSEATGLRWSEAQLGGRVALLRAPLHQYLQSSPGGDDPTVVSLFDRVALRRVNSPTFAAGAAVFSMAVGGTVLVGWALGNDALRSVIPGVAYVRTNAAFGFVTVGGALWCNRRPDVHPRLARALAAMVALVAGVTLLEYLSGRDLGIDRLLFDHLHSTTQAAADRMTISATVCFLLLAVALLMLDTSTRWWRRMTQALIASSASLSVLAVVGYLFGSDRLDPGSVYSTMPINTALAMLVVSAGVAWARPNIGIAELATRRDPGGALLRHLIPVVVGVPLVAGLVATRAVDAGLFDSRFGRALLVTSIVVSFAVVLVASARSLSRTYRHLAIAETDAEIDSLSGLLNRRGIDRRFLELSPGDAMVLIDLDDFKSVNDLHGHAVGDDLLKRFSGFLMRTCRSKNDWVGRLGGDEFIVVLAKAGESGATRFTSQLYRQWHATRPIATYSAGIAVYDLPLEPRQVLARADEALYLAKTQGRDQAHAFALTTDGSRSSLPLPPRTTLALLEQEPAITMGALQSQIEMFEKQLRRTQPSPPLTSVPDRRP
jgi:diguanylate cyclase (GGDEF)-like protein